MKYSKESDINVLANSFNHVALNSGFDGNGLPSFLSSLGITHDGCPLKFNYQSSDNQDLKRTFEFANYVSRLIRHLILTKVFSSKTVFGNTAFGSVGNVNSLSLGPLGNIVVKFPKKWQGRILLAIVNIHRSWEWLTGYKWVVAFVSTLYGFYRWASTNDVESYIVILAIFVGVFFGLIFKGSSGSPGGDRENIA